MPIAFEEFEIGKNKDIFTTEFDFRGKLVEGTYTLELDLSIERSVFDSSSVFASHFIHGGFEFSVMPAPATLSLLAMAGIIGPRRRRCSEATVAR